MISPALLFKKKIILLKSLLKYHTLIKFVQISFLFYLNSFKLMIWYRFPFESSFTWTENSININNLMKIFQMLSNVVSLCITFVTYWTFHLKIKTLFNKKPSLPKCKYILLDARRCVIACEQLVSLFEGMLFRRFGIYVDEYPRVS